MALVPITGGVGSTTYTVTAGAIGNIVDGTAATTCSVSGNVTSVPPFWFVDLGSPHTVEQVVFQGLSEAPGTGDTGFTIRYSNSTFGTAAGTTYGSDVGAVPGSPGLSGTQVGTVTAQFWGIERSGNFSTTTLTLGELTMYEQPQTFLDTTSKMW